MLQVCPGPPKYLPDPYLLACPWICLFITDLSIWSAGGTSLPWAHEPCSWLLQDCTPFRTTDLFLINSHWSFKICINHWWVWIVAKMKTAQSFAFSAYYMIAYSIMISCKNWAIKCTTKKLMNKEPSTRQVLLGKDKQKNLQCSSLPSEEAHHNWWSYTGHSWTFRLLSQL